MMKKSIVGLVFCFLFLATNAFALPPVLDTGDPNERICSSKSHTDPGNGIVRDNVPGSEWQQATVPVALRKFESPKGKFSVSIPKEWTQIESFPFGDDTVNGVMLKGPENPQGAPITMAVLHYAGKGLIEGAQDYIGRVLFNPTRTETEQETQFTDIEVAGIKGTTFTFKKFHLVYVIPFYAPPMEDGVIYEMAPQTQTVGMIVRYIVIPVKAGFYSFAYEAPEDLYEDFSGVFDTVVKSFTYKDK